MLSFDAGRIPNLYICPEEIIFFLRKTLHMVNLYDRKKWVKILISNKGSYVEVMEYWLAAKTVIMETVGTSYAIVC